jgi:uracil-DNA glycosylase
VAPSVLVLLGNVPAKALVDRSFAIGFDRGVWSESVLRAPAIATYHPAYVVRLRGTDFEGTRELVVSDLVAAWERARRAADGA